MAGSVPSVSQSRSTNYKYTANMRNPPTQVSMVTPQTAVQAVHVKGMLEMGLYKRCAMS